MNVRITSPIDYRVLNYIFHRPNQSRYDISRALRMNISSVNNSVQKLLGGGLVLEELAAAEKIGRRPYLLRVNEQFGYFIGIDFNAQQMHCVVINTVGSILLSKYTLVSPNDSKEHIIDLVCRFIDQSLDFLGPRAERVISIGLAVPGYIDKNSDICMSYVHMEHWKNVDLCAVIRSRYQIECFIENNINCMTLGYKWAEFDQAGDNFVFFAIRGGSRISFFIDGSLYHGTQGFAGEIGHWKLYGANRRCACGERGCLDTEVSNIAILDKIREGLKEGRFQGILKLAGGDAQKIDILTFVRAVNQGDQEAAELMWVCAEFCANAVSSIYKILNINDIIFSGDIVTHTSFPFVEVLQKQLQEDSRLFAVDKIRISTYPTNQNFAAFGAGILCMEENFHCLNRIP